MKQQFDRRRRSFLGTGLAALSAGPLGSLVGCGGGGESSGPADDTTPPSVLAISPANSAQSVDRNTVPSITFTENVSAPDGSVTLTGPHGEVAVKLSTNGAVVQVSPQRPLEFGGRYSLAVTSNVKDAAGNPSAASTSSFTALQRNPALSLGALIIDTYVRRLWGGFDSGWNVWADLYDNGFEWARVWVTTQTFPELRAISPDKWSATYPWRNEYWSCLEVSGALLREAADLGMRLQAVLFLSAESSHAGRQPRPPEWLGLTEAEVAAKIEEHATNVASYYKSLGLAIEVFEIGNETDFGLCGVELVTTVPVPPGVDPVNDPNWMRDNVWAKEAPLMQAAIRGVRSVYPAAKILLHVAGFGYSNGDIAPKGFFRSMIELGVDYDIAGLSYPYLYAGNPVPQPYFAEANFISTLDYVASLGKRVQIVEFNYPAATAGIPFAPSPSYPLTPAGQAGFIADFAAAVRGKVDAIFYWYPDWHPEMDATHPELESSGLFATAGVGRPALGVFNAIAERRLLG